MQKKSGDPSIKPELHEYLRFILWIFPQWESNSSRVARGDWQSILEGWGCIVRDNSTGKIVLEFYDASDPDSAYDYATDILLDHYYLRWT